MQLVAMVVTVGVVRSCEVDGVLCVHPIRGILVLWSLKEWRTVCNKG